MLAPHGIGEVIGHAGHDSDAQCRSGSGVGRDSVSPSSSPSFAQPFTPDIGDEAPSRLGEQRRDPVLVPHHGLVAVPRMDCEGGIRRRRAPGARRPVPHSRDRVTAPNAQPGPVRPSRQRLRLPRMRQEASRGREKGPGSPGRRRSVGPGRPKNHARRV